jgi:RNA polymerase sigma-70 factor (ECF subfamily)
MSGIIHVHPVLDHPPTNAPSDAELLASGTVAAFRSVYERHAGAVRGYALGRVGPDGADDVVSETFAEAWTARSKFDARASNARPWLYGIATNVIARHREREERWIEANRRATATHARPGSEPTAYELDPHLALAIGELSPSLRDVLLLTALGELSVAETARALGMTTVAARVRLHRARRQLTDALTKEHLHD